MIFLHKTIEQLFEHGVVALLGKYSKCDFIVVNKSEIKMNERYHEYSHLESSPWSPHGRNEGPAILFGVVTLHSPQTLLSVVTSCKIRKIHQGQIYGIRFFLCSRKLSFS